MSILLRISELLFSLCKTKSLYDLHESTQHTKSHVESPNRGLKNLLTIVQLRCLRCENEGFGRSAQPAKAMFPRATEIPRRKQPLRWQEKVHHLSWHSMEERIDDFTIGWTTDEGPIA